MLPATCWGEWLYFGDSKHGDKHYYDPETIINDGKYLYYWTVIDLLKPNPFGDMSVKMFTKLDCDRLRFKFIQVLYYEKPMVSGSINDESPVDKKWYTAEDPDIITEDLLKHICKTYN